MLTLPQPGCDFPYKFVAMKQCSQAARNLLSAHIHVKTGITLKRLPVTDVLEILL